MIKKSSNEMSTVYKALSPMVKKAQPIPDDGIADGGEPYTDEEMQLMSKEQTQEPPKSPSNNIGVMLAQRLTSALMGVNTNDYKQRSEAIYGELSAIASELHEGDWVSFPDGTTFTMTFKPTARQTTIQASSGVTIKVANAAHGLSADDIANANKLMQKIIPQLQPIVTQQIQRLKQNPKAMGNISYYLRDPISKLIAQVDPVSGPTRGKYQNYLLTVLQEKASQMAQQSSPPKGSAVQPVPQNTIQAASGVTIKVAKDSYDWSWHEHPYRTAPCKKCGKNKPIYQDNKCKDCKTKEIDEGEEASRPTGE